MAGVQGFEPRNAWTKTRCLTAWRYPNVLKVGIIALYFLFVKIKLAVLRYNLSFDDLKIKVYYG